MTTWTDVHSVLLRYLLTASVVAVLLPAVGWLVVSCCRLRLAIYRHIVWSWCLAGIVILPILWLYVPKMSVAVLPDRAAKVVSVVSQGVDVAPLLLANPQPRRSTSVVSAVESPPNTLSPAPVASVSWAEVFVMAWLAGTTIMLARIALGMRQLARIASRAEVIDRPASHPAFPKATVRVLLSDAVTGPICFGLLRPGILLPRRMYQESNPVELRMVLRHELAHVQRRDAWVNLLQRFVEGILFFHPGVWLASRQLTQQRELICDNWVLADGAEPREYARILARVAEASLAPRLHAAALFEGRLLQRVRSLLDVSSLRPARLSTPAWLLASAGALLVLGVLGIVRPSASPSASPGQLVIKVVDEAGKPVEGAKVVPFGISALPNAASTYLYARWDARSEKYSYGVPPQPAMTDAAGEARLAFPKRIRSQYEGAEADMDTCAIILAVYHKNYSPAVEQSYPTDKAHAPLVLHPGATLKLSGYISSPEAIVTNVWPQVSDWNVPLDEVAQVDKGLCTIRGLPVGPHYIRLVYWPAKGAPRFSDPVLVDAKPNQTRTLNLELKAPMRLEGELDESVPRPVHNGYVQVHVSYPAEFHSDAGYSRWDDWARINEDGTFRIDALPQGAVQVIGVCDGFTWQIPGADTEEGYGVSALSQEFAPQGDTAHVRLKMQPAATFKVSVVDPEGRPIVGAKVSSYPLARWFSSRVQVVDPLRRTADEIRRTAADGKMPPLSWVHYYDAVTDSQGIAVLHNLPAYGKPIFVSVEHETYTRLWDGSLTQNDMVAAPGETWQITVTMIPKGTQAPATQGTTGLRR